MDEGNNIIKKPSRNLENNKSSGRKAHHRKNQKKELVIIKSPIKHSKPLPENFFAEMINNIEKTSNMSLDTPKLEEKNYKSALESPIRRLKQLKNYSNKKSIRKYTVEEGLFKERRVHSISPKNKNITKAESSKNPKPEKKALNFTSSPTYFKEDHFLREIFDLKNIQINEIDEKLESSSEESGDSDSDIGRPNIHNKNFFDEEISFIKEVEDLFVPTLLFQKTEAVLNQKSSFPYLRPSHQYIYLPDGEKEPELLQIPFGLLITPFLKVAEKKEQQIPIFDGRDKQFTCKNCSWAYKSSNTLENASEKSKCENCGKSILLDQHICLAVQNCKSAIYDLIIKQKNKKLHKISKRYLFLIHFDNKSNQSIFHYKVCIKKLRILFNDKNWTPCPEAEFALSIVTTTGIYYIFLEENSKDLVKKI